MVTIGYIDMGDRELEPDLRNDKKAWKVGLEKCKLNWVAREHTHTHTHTYMYLGIYLYIFQVWYRGFDYTKYNVYWMSI